MADDVFHLLRFYILLEFHNLQFFFLASIDTGFK